jgi:hypothetical protein
MHCTKNPETNGHWSPDMIADNIKKTDAIHSLKLNAHYSNVQTLLSLCRAGMPISVKKESGTYEQRIIKKYAG